MITWLGTGRNCTKSGTLSIVRTSVWSGKLRYWISKMLDSQNSATLHLTLKRHCTLLLMMHAVLWSQNYLFRLQLQLRLFKSFRSSPGSDLSFVGTCFSQLLYEKSRFFMSFRKEYLLNSFFWSYSIWIMI